MSSLAYIALSRCTTCGKIHRHIFTYPDGNFESWGMQDCSCPLDSNGKKFEVLDGFMTLDEWMEYMDERRNNNE